MDEILKKSQHFDFKILKKFGARGLEFGLRHGLLTLMLLRPFCGGQPGWHLYWQFPSFLGVMIATLFFATVELVKRRKPLGLMNSMNHVWMANEHNYHGNKSLRAGRCVGWADLRHFQKTALFLCRRTHGKPKIKIYCIRRRDRVSSGAK